MRISTGPCVLPHNIPHTVALPSAPVVITSVRSPELNVPVAPSPGSWKLTAALATGLPVSSVTSTLSPRVALEPVRYTVPSPSNTFSCTMTEAHEGIAQARAQPKTSSRMVTHYTWRESGDILIRVYPPSSAAKISFAHRPHRIRQRRPRLLELVEAPALLPSIPYRRNPHRAARDVLQRSAGLWVGGRLGGRIPGSREIRHRSRNHHSQSSHGRTRDCAYPRCFGAGPPRHHGQQRTYRSRLRGSPRSSPRGPSEIPVRIHRDGRRAGIQHGEERFTGRENSWFYRRIELHFESCD